MRSEEKNTAINIVNVSKSFAGGVTVFQNLSLSITKRDRVCFFGPSGCGKTTLFRLMAGLAKPDSGAVEIFLGGRGRKIGFLFQEPRLLPWKTVYQNISLVLKKEKKTDKQVERNVKKVTEMMRISSKINRYPWELSGGEKQRVALARALVINPEILFLDEPFIHLDEDTAMKLRIDIKQLLEKIKATFIFSTHNPLEAAYFASKIVVLERKRKTGIKKIIKINKTMNYKVKNLYQALTSSKEIRRVVRSIFS